MSVNADAAFATTIAVSVDSNVPDAVNMRVRDAAAAWSEWQPYAAAMPLILTSGDGTKTVEAEYRNLAGTLPLSDTIVLDATGPDGSVVINGGDAQTAQRGVTLTCAASDANGVPSMRISADGVFDTETWQAFASTVSFTLPSGNGAKTVHVQYKDSAGSISTCSDTIILNAPFWTYSTSTGMTGQPYQISFADADNGWAFGGNGSLSHTTDGGTTWSGQNSTQNSSRGGWALSPSIVVMSGASQNIIRSTDGGATWTQVLTGAGAQLNSFFFVDSTNGWVCGQSGKVFKTIDGGETWTALGNPGSVSLWRVAFLPDGQTGWVTGQSGKIYKTTDGGATWSPQSSGSTNARITGLSIVDSQTVYACSSQGTGSLVWWKTTDGGTNWISSVIEAGVTYYDITFLDANNGWVVGYAPGFVARIYRTTDGGASWTTQVSEGTMLFCACAVDADHVWAGASSKVAKYFPGDFTAPSAVSNLALAGFGPESVDLNWTAPGDNVSTSEYDLRYSLVPITDDLSFDLATRVAGVPAPHTVGTSESFS